MNFVSIGLLLAITAHAYSHDDVEIIWESNKAVGVLILGISDGFQVQLKGSNNSILGKTSIKDGGTVFYPLWAFTRGLTYEIISKGSLFASFTIPKYQSEAAPEISVYPTTEIIPENLLKMYIVFSQPMSQGRALDFIQLKNSASSSTENAFLDLQPELWNEDATILTLWLDPGRIKRDLGPNKILGTPIVEGQSYELVISGNWKSQMEISLGKEFSKAFKVTGSDRNSPALDNWTINYPRGKTRDKLTIDFGESMDYLLSLKAISVSTEGKELSGEILFEENESSWNFIPTEAWHSNEYQIVVESRLEDLAGNNLNWLFDRDITEENKNDQSPVKYITFIPGL